MRICIRFVALVALALGTCVTSCGGKTEESSTTAMVPADTGLAPGTVPEPGNAPAPTVGDSSTPSDRADTSKVTVSDSLPSVSVSGTLAELRQRLRREALKLDHAVAAGTLKEVIVRSTLVRDVAVAIGGKAGEFPKASAAELEKSLADLTDLTDKMRADARTKKRPEVKADNALLQPLVARVIKLSIPPA